MRIFEDQETLDKFVNDGLLLGVVVKEKIRRRDAYIDLMCMPGDTPKIYRKDKNGHFIEDTTLDYNKLRKVKRN